MALKFQGGGEIQALGVLPQLPLLFLGGEGIGADPLHGCWQIAVITGVEGRQGDVGPLTLADEANRLIGDVDLGLKIVFRNDLKHRFDAFAARHHIAAADVEVEHQAGDGRLNTDPGEQHFGFANLGVEAGDAVEVGLNLFAQAGFTAALVCVPS